MSSHHVSAQPLRSHPNANVGTRPRMRFAQTQGALRRLCLKLSTTEDENCPPRKGKESATCEVHQRCCLLQNIRDAHLRRLDHPPSDGRRSPVSAKIYLFEGLGGNSHQGHAAPRLRAGQALCRRRLPLRDGVDVGRRRLQVVAITIVITTENGLARALRGSGKRPRDAR